MRIKSKSELNFVHIAVLAICPLIMIILNLNDALAVLALTVLSFVLTLFICLVLVKNSNNNLRIFIGAFVASLVVVAYELLARQGIFSAIGREIYFSILSTIILCIDPFYIDTKAKSKYYILKAMRLLLVFATILIVYVSAKEFLTFGRIAGIQLFGHNGYEFFGLIVFDFLLLGLLCAFFVRVSNFISSLYTQRRLVYNKYKTKVRNEKKFLYEHYRRNNLLSSEVVINKVGFKEEEEDFVEDDFDVEEAPQKEKPRKSEIMHKPRRKSKLKVSKEAKVEKLFDRNNKEDKDA